MKRLLFLSIFTLLAVALFADPYSSDTPSPLDDTSMDVTFHVGDSAADKIIVAFTDTPCTSFDNNLVEMAKGEIKMVFDSNGNFAITDKKYYISYIIVTEQNVKLKLTASKKITHNTEAFAYEITTDSGKIFKSDKGDKYIEIPVKQSNSSYGKYGSEGFTIISQSTVGSNDIYGAHYYGLLNVEVITV